MDPFIAEVRIYDSSFSPLPVGSIAQLRPGQRPSHAGDEHEIQYDVAAGF